MSVRDMLMAATQATNTAFRYWRILINSNNGDPNYVSISEVELRLTVGGADVTTSTTPVTARSYYDATYQPSNVVDGINPSIGWISGNNAEYPQWLLFDLGVDRDIKQVSISASNVSSGGARAPNTFSIQGSSDGTSFTTVKSFTSTGWALSETRVFNL